MYNNTIIKPAICCLGYNRLGSMERLLCSIGMAEYPFADITLIISIDECKESDSVQKVAEEFQWHHGEKIIKRYPERLGVKKHTLIIGDMSYQYGAVIYLEDDIVVSPGFYIYAFEAVNKYKNNKDIFGVALYNQKWLGTAQTEFIPCYRGDDTYLFSGDVSWGQCWVSNQWKEFHAWYNAHMGKLPDYNCGVPKSVYRWDTNSSWSKFISFYLAERMLFYVVPYASYSTCFSDKGVHTGLNSDQCQVTLSQKTGNDFKFCEIGQAVKYDAFFERIDRFVDKIDGIDIGDICIDLNGEKYDFSGYKAILTTKKLDYKCLCSFGINMDPVELNVIYKMPGNVIRLYELPTTGSVRMFDEIEVPTGNKERIFHQLGKFRVKYLLSVVLSKIKRHLIGK